MTLSIQNDAVGAGTGTVLPDEAWRQLTTIANLDTGLGMGPTTGNLTRITYARSDPGIPPRRLDTLVNTTYELEEREVDILLLAVGPAFTFRDGTLITTVGGSALAPRFTDGPSSNINGTDHCVVVYDTSNKNGRGYCVARAGGGGVLNLGIPLSVLLYHELSHAFRIVTDAVRSQLPPTCNPAPPEEAAAVEDENHMRRQVAVMEGKPVALRDPVNYCGTTCPANVDESCCIVASVSSGSPLSAEVAQLRAVRDQFLRRSEVGYAFFDSLHYAYYGFSPQVVTVLAGDLDVRATVLHGFVRPLIRMLRLISAYALEGVDADELGRRCRADLGDPDETGVTQAVLDRAVALTRGLDAPGLSPAERKVAKLLTARALPDPHISWALIEPLQIYHLLLRSLRDGSAPGAVGRQLVDSVADWAGRLPIDTCWGAFDLDTARRELAGLESGLLRAPQSRRVFLDRLAERYAAATAIATLVGERAKGVAP